MAIVAWLISMCMAYFVGAFPTGFLIARLRGIKNITDHGSGSMGATNVARALGWPYFFLVFFFDFFKAYAYLSLLIFCNSSLIMQQLCAGMLLFGNAFSWFVQGRGGKGVASTIGILAALFPSCIPYVMVIWFVCFALTHTVGIASACALGMLPLYGVMHHGLQDAWFFLMGLAAWSIWCHKTNITNYAMRFTMMQKGNA